MLRRLLAMVIPVFMLVGVVVLLVLAMQHFEQGQPAPVQNSEAQPRQPQYTLNTTEWTRFGDDGKPVFHITAQSIDYYPDQSAVLHDLTMDRLNQGDGPWHLSSPQGEMPAHEQRVRLDNPVTVTGQFRDGRELRMTTTELWVDHDKQQIYTDKPVTVIGAGGQHAQAVGMLARMDGENLQLQHDVRVDYVPAAKR